MELSFSKVLNIERHERGIVYLLLAQSVFLGIFAGSLDVGANALFLDVYSADLMPNAFMISGAVGIVFTSIYTALQKRLSFKIFTILNLIFVIAVALLLRIGYGISSDPRLTFALLVLMGPLIIIGMLGFWGTAGRYFSLREGKRLFGIIDTGSIIGMILAFYAVPILVNFRFQVHDTLLIGLVSLVIALGLQIALLQGHKMKVAAGVPTIRRQRSGFFAIFRKRYTSLMAIFIMLSVISGFFIHYSFMWVTEVNYTSRPELTSFLGTFFGTMMIFTVVIKSTLYGWLMKNYGLRVSLLISPALLLILTVIASFVGGFYGYGAEAGGFTFFFLVIALSKLFNKSLKDAIESPSMKTLYQSLDPGERFDVQARIDGVVNEFTAFFSGLVMAGLLVISFVNVIHFSYILILLLVAWVILGLMLYRSYRRTLDESLVRARTQTTDYESNIPGEAQHSGEVTMFSDMVRLDPGLYYSTAGKELDHLLTSSNIRTQFFAWEMLSDKVYPVSDALVQQAKKLTQDAELLGLIKAYSKRLRKPEQQLADSFRSGNKDQVFAALMQSIRENNMQQIPQLIALLRDRDPDIRKAAIETAGKLQARQLGSYLVDYLGHPVLYDVTWYALVGMGEPILENLENGFHKTGVNKIVQLRIVKAMTAIGGNIGNNYLFSKIDYHQREIREAVIHGLYLNDFVPSERGKSQLLAVMYDVALAGAGYIVAEYIIRKNNPDNGLLEALAEEKRKTDQLLFTLLRIAYDRHAVEHIQGSLDDPENEDTGFALELLNLVVDDEVFAYLEPYFDVLSVPEKIRRMQNEMPVTMMDLEELLVDLLNKDRLHAGSYVRTCAIDAIRSMKSMDASKYLAAQAFHPDPVISHTALSALTETNPDLLSDILSRMEQYAHDPGTSANQELIEPGRATKLVEELVSWPLFMKAERELLYLLVNQFIEEEKVSLENRDVVSLVRISSHPNEMLSEGLIINLSDYSALQNQLRQQNEHQEFRCFQVNRMAFRELIFDLPALLKICSEQFAKPGAASLLHFKNAEI